MHRFVAMLWDPALPDLTEQVTSWSDVLMRGAAAWTPVLDRPGFRLLVMTSALGEARALLLPGSDGAIVGRLYLRGEEHAGPVRTLAAEVARHMVASAGDTLIRHAWGQYVAVWQDPSARQTIVVRDPSGAVPCFMTEASGIRLLFSYAADVASLPGLAFSIDWNHVQAFLHHGYFTTPHTGLCEISELLPGQRMTLCESQTPAYSWAWDPTRFAADHDNRAVEDLREEVRAIVSSCVAATARSHRRILLQLSGGLDSSILLALLRRAGSDVVALHTVSAGYEGYELALARLAASHAGVELIERSVDPTAVDLNMILKAPVIARPSGQIIGLPANDLIGSVCQDIGADAVMAGHGGDTLFLQRGLAGHLASDWMRLRGLGPGLLRVAYDQATLEQRSVWGVLGELREVVFDRERWSPYAFLETVGASNTHSLAPMDQSALPQSYWRHPWLDAAKSLPPGKRDQLVGFLGLYNYFAHYGYGVSLDALNPYQSQPIAELSLRIPSYQFVRGGRDRSLQRDAFADVIPARIAVRTGKGLINHQLLVSLAHNADFLRALVLDGDLAKQTWINRPAVETLFSSDRMVRGDGLMQLLALASAEAWLQAWRRTRS